MSTLSLNNLLHLVGRISRSQIGMYFLIGGVASAIDVGLFLWLHEIIGISSVSSHSISIPVSALYSFFCNAYLNFKTRNNLLVRLVSFSIVVFLGYLLGAGIIILVETYTPFGGSVGKFVSLPAVFFFQYFLNSRISFRKSSNG